MRLYLESDVTLHGITHDVSTHSVAVFVNLKNASALYGAVAAGRAPLSAIKGKLLGQTALLEIAEEGLDPINFTIQRVEPSWKKGFHLFIGGRFVNADEFLVKKLEQVCPALLPGPRQREVYVSEGLPDFLEDLRRLRAEEFVCEFSNGYHNVRDHRDLVTALAAHHEFPEEEIYGIKLLADEALMNAFLYGSIEPGRDRTQLRALLAPGRIYLAVRDYAGIEFDDFPYHFRKERADQRGGLSLLEELSDDWQVQTVPGEYTEVCFFKAVASPSSP